MQGGGGLVLSMAGASQCRKIGIVEVAVGDDVIRRKGIRKHVGAAVSIHVAAVVRSTSRRGRRGLVSNGVQASSNRATGGAGCRLEILLETGGRSRLRGSSSCTCQRDCVSQSSLKGRQSAARAGSDLGAAFQDLNCLSNTRGLSCIYINGELVRGEWNVSSDLVIGGNRY